MEPLLNRDTFRRSIFARDGYKCVICGFSSIPDEKGDCIGLDAHHIIERRLFSDGGYYLSNGATLCEKHHIEAEQTTLSVEEIRLACKIEKYTIPEHFYNDVTYDKWGNVFLDGNKRTKGELFYDESVQKILKQGGVIHDFVKYVKYPRTYHLPWSYLSKDDRQLKNDNIFLNKNVIVSLKMDGENSTLYNDYIHARSINSGSHESRNWLKGYWSQFAYMLDENMRICGENLYAKHTVFYNDLPSYFMLFSIWIDNVCLSWDETLEYANILNLHTVPIIYEGEYNKEKIIQSFKEYEKTHEGYVVRLADSFNFSNFNKSIAKYVNPWFKQAINDSHGHWISKKIIPNKLKI